MCSPFAVGATWSAVLCACLTLKHIFSQMYILSLCCSLWHHRTQQLQVHQMEQLAKRAGATVRNDKLRIVRRIVAAFMHRRLSAAFRRWQRGTLQVGLVLVLATVPHSAKPSRACVCCLCVLPLRALHADPFRSPVAMSIDRLAPECSPQKSELPHRTNSKKNLPVYSAPAQSTPHTT